MRPPFLSQTRAGRFRLIAAFWLGRGEHFFCAAFAGLALAGVPALAQQTEMPAVGETRPFELPAIESYELPNGLQVTLAPFGLAPKTTIVLAVRAGNLDEGRDTWLADLTGKLMQEGAAGRPAEEIAREAGSMGGQLDVSVDRHTTDLSIAVLAERGPDAVRLLADVARRPDLPESEIERLKGDLRRNLAVALAQPQPVADAAFYAALYSTDHPYGRLLPTDDQLAGYTIDDVRTFYAENFGARRARLYVSGQFDSEAMRAAIEQAFGGWEAGTEPARVPVEPAFGPRVILIDRPGAEQSTIRLGLPVPRSGTAQDIPLRVMDALLGGSFTSRLIQNLREEKGYTYSPDSGFTRLLGVSNWYFAADVTTDATGPALEETFKEIRRLADEVPPDEEAAGIRRWVSGVFVLQTASPRGLIRQLAERDLLGLSPNWLEAFTPAVQAVTDQDISDAARTYLPVDRMILVVVGDLAVIEPQIAALPDLAGARIEVKGREPDSGSPPSP